MMPMMMMWGRTADADDASMPMPMRWLLIDWCMMKFRQRWPMYAADYADGADDDDAADIIFRRLFLFDADWLPASRGFWWCRADDYFDASWCRWHWWFYADYDDYVKMAKDDEIFSMMCRWRRLLTAELRHFSDSREADSQRWWCKDAYADDVPKIIAPFSIRMARWADAIFRHLRRWLRNIDYSAEDADAD